MSANDNEFSLKVFDPDMSLFNSWKLKQTQANMETPLPFEAVESGWDQDKKLQFLRENKLGRLSLIPSPDFFQDIHPKLRSSGYKTLLHLDYTASAQGLAFIESYIADCMKTYANTHTETSATGKYSTNRFHKAIESIRKHVNGGRDSFVIPSGYGATGAIEKVQKILGLYFSPKGQKNARELFHFDLKAKMKEKFVVFVGPSEHHSNDVTWQDASLCQFVRIKAVKEGPFINHVDLQDLETQLGKFPNHIKIGSFSAASNVTGLKAQLKEIGQVLRRYNAYFFVDYAASGPYADMDMTENQIDALFLSMHKNLGGANLGVLVGKSHIYDLKANPSFGGGGTVSAVTPWDYHFHEKIEEREYPGTPAIRQVWQAALSFETKDWVGKETIETVDQALSEKMINFMEDHPQILLLGNKDPKQRFPIFSFLVRHGDKMLHHTLVAALFNDLFGIQARSGCACAGPFGHELLNIAKEQSDKYVELILNVLNGFKPGWTRIGTHYSLSEEEVDYTIKALNGIAYFGALFLDQYQLNPFTGEWTHDRSQEDPIELSIEDAIGRSKGANQLPTLSHESDLYIGFRNQLKEFQLLVSCKITKLLIASLDHLSMEDFESLSMSALTVVEGYLDQIRFFQEDDFINSLAAELCPKVVPSERLSESCKEGLRTLLNDLVFKPQNNLSTFEDFSETTEAVDFFYVTKGKLNPGIDWTKVKKPIICPAVDY
ncbi:MAG: aminotransferase class V-fold PLP-dependent enzyme [Pseudobacteriovorax sp.]|nr:aminotransferase class V-fold PLP-dependent enzyme [Pseudobacteriovorax sp.]